MKKRRFGKTIMRVQQAIESKVVICSALLFVAGLNALAQDNSSQTINFKDISNAIYRGATKPPNPLACVGFYDNICGVGYNGSTGWRVSDHTPAFEYSPAMQFTAVKSGVSTKITLGLTYVNGTDAAVGIVTEDCGGAPCTTPDGQPAHRQLCGGKVSHMPKFQSTNTITVSFACRAQLEQGRKYWVLLQSLANSGLAWNYSNSATGPVYDGVLDSWVNLGSRHTGAMTIQ
jgi:hypothetical protein